MTERFHLFPSRTQKLSSPVLKVLGWTRPGRISRCRIPIALDSRESRALFLSFGGKEKIPRANDWAQGMRLLFPMILVFSGSARGLCGRPLDAFASHVTMGKKRRGGTDDGSARGHSVQTSPTESRERVKGGTPLQGAGTASLLGSRGKAPWVFQRPCHPNGGGGNSGKSGQVGAGLPHASHRVM